MMRIAILALTIGFAVTGCATVEADADRAEASDIESTLRGAGFVLIPSDTPARIEAMRTLPPLAFSQVIRDGRPYYVYADPRSCLCIWVGTPPQFRRYLVLATEDDVGAAQGEIANAELQAELWDPDWQAIDY
jgi:hypothetical protein